MTSRYKRKDTAFEDEIKRVQSETKTAVATVSKNTECHNTISPQDTVEKELKRKTLYQEILSWLSRRLYNTPHKDIGNILVRYIFNKIIAREEDDDPVFVETISPLARMQLCKDFSYFHIPLDSVIVAQEIDLRLVRAASRVKTNTRIDEEITITGDGIQYKNKIYPDVGKLAVKFPHNISKILALNIRYTYLSVNNYGLSADFYRDLNPDEGCEAFASAFNRYFTEYYSAFPDLEGCLGSSGSFFKEEKWNRDRIVYINPPFDETLITVAVEKILKYLQNGGIGCFVFILPEWNDMESICELKHSRWTESIKLFKKGEFDFINPSKKGYIHPCNILKITLKNHQ